MKKIKTALISVYYKDGLLPVLETLSKLNVRILSTGGTYDFIVQNGYQAETVESLTGFPSILGGRVKTLHPAIMGGILARLDNMSDQHQLEEYHIPPIDLVVVDLYPFEETVKSTQNEAEIIEKIDIGGISLIRAAAKNFNEVLVIPSSSYYPELLQLIEDKNGFSGRDDRSYFAVQAFNVSSHYDTAIFSWMNKGRVDAFKVSQTQIQSLRYGENPHQKGSFFGKLEDVFEQIHGKAISYNNLLDLDAAINLINDFEDTTFAVIKHNNACGLASREILVDAWKDALAGDPLSAFGGVLVTNRIVDEATAVEINKIFFETIVAPGFESKALEILEIKKNRIILKLKPIVLPATQFKSLLNGVIVQEKDLITEIPADLTPVTIAEPSVKQIEDLIFANKIVKHTKSNTIVLAYNKQLVGSGTGQTSRVDALKQAIEKARTFELTLEGAVMASDAFFPFADSVEIADKAGIKAVIQPGGSVRDQDSVDYCNVHNIAMVTTGIRHFKH